MKISVVLGTRPEIIKMSPIIRELERSNRDYFILHTGQHYSYNMDKIFFDQLRLPEAKYNLEVGSGTHGSQTGKMLIGIEKILIEEKPDIILVQGDTNTVLAGSIAACKIGIRVGHLEAGLRSYDRLMPEEFNRILTDHCSDYLFAPTENSAKVLRNEGIPSEKIYVTGNTIVDAIYQNLQLSESMKNVLEKYNLTKNEYFLTTVHRQKNVDNKIRFKKILEGLEKVGNEFNKPVVYPIHPRAKKRINEYCISPNLMIIEAVDYFDFIQLEKNAKVILTDSGGVQEEACILKVPCVTLRDNTERPETITVGANTIAGVDPSEILKSTQMMNNTTRDWDNPFGDGMASKYILEIIMKGY